MEGRERATRSGRFVQASAAIVFLPLHRNLRGGRGISGEVVARGDSSCSHDGVNLYFHCGSLLSFHFLFW